MKIAKLLPSFLFTVALAFSGCKKSTPALILNNTITYTFQGIKYTVTNPLVSRQTAGLTISGQVIGGAGANVIIENYQSTNSEALYGPAYVNIDLTNSNQADYYYCYSGTLTVSSVSITHITGTFTGTAMHIGNNTGTPITGTFNVDIPQQ